MFQLLREAAVEHLQAVFVAFAQLGAQQRIEAESLLDAIRVTKTFPANTQSPMLELLTECEREVATLHYAKQPPVLLRWIGCQRLIYNAKVQEDRFFHRFFRRMGGTAGADIPMDP